MSSIRQDPVPLADAVADLFGRIDERQRHLELRDSAWKEGWLAGHAIGYEAGRRDALAEESAQRREAAGLVREATAGPSHAVILRRRWALRGQARTRETFARPHKDDYPGRDGAA